MMQICRFRNLKRWNVMNSQLFYFLMGTCNLNEVRLLWPWYWILLYALLSVLSVIGVLSCQTSNKSSCFFVVLPGFLALHDFSFSFLLHLVVNVGFLKLENYVCATYTFYQFDNHVNIISTKVTCFLSLFIF